MRRRLQAFWKSLRARLPIKSVIRAWMRLPASTRALPIHILRGIDNFRNYGLRQAAALSYYAVFSIFPLILLLTIAVNSILGSTVAREQITQALVLFLPEETDTINLMRDSVSQAVDQSGSFTLVALLGLSWSALGLFSNLTTALDRIFQVPASRSLWKQRSLAFLMTLVLVFLIIFSFITSGILWLVDAFFLSSPNLWIRIGTFFLPYGLNMVIFVLLFRYVPSRHVNWDAVWPAAILGAVALELSKVVFAWYLTNLGGFQPVYGSIATSIVLLLWAYLFASIFLISAEICAQLNLWFLNYGEDSARIRILSDTSTPSIPAEMPPPV